MTDEPRAESRNVDSLVRPFAVLRLTDLHVYRFDHKDEMLDAIRAMRERGIGFVPLLNHPEEKTYVVPETWQ